MTEIHLCQVNETISCSACCGLYNVIDCSFETLSGLLHERTERFEKTPASIQGIFAFKKETESLEKTDRPFPEFHHCPFIGMIGQYRSRPGCLLHPLVPKNKGMDFRSVSHYGGMACHVYFCPSCRELPFAMKRLIIDISESWFEYGLWITETDLITAFLSELQDRVSGISASDIPGILADHPEKVMEFMRLKMKPGGKSASRSVLCNYFFRDGVYEKPFIDYKLLGGEPSRYDRIFRELGFRFSSVADLQKEENRLDMIFEDLAQKMCSSRINTRF